MSIQGLPISNLLLPNVFGGGSEYKVWDPIAKPDLIQSGIYKKGIYLIESPTSSDLDFIPAGTVNQLISFNISESKWQIISGDASDKGIYETDTQLIDRYPTAKNGDYAYIKSTNTYWNWSNIEWVDTGESSPPDVLKKNFNLSDLSDISIARTNLDVYSKSETDDFLSDVRTKTYSFTNQNTITIDHFLGRYPVVQVKNENNRQIDCDIRWTNSNRFVVYFNRNITGVIIYN